jgi:hypothetical protein
MIRNKRRRRRALAPRNAVNDENFLIAKTQDSESTTAPPSVCERLTRTSLAHDAHHARVTKTPSVIGFSAILTIADVGRSGIFRIRILKRRVVFANHAAHLRGFLRQHFLKREAVFFDVLVYSE